MQDDYETNQIRVRARNLLRGRTIGDDLVVKSGRVEVPIAVHSPDGRHHSWFVPVTVSKQIVGFFQFLSDGTFMRFSSFQHRVGELAGCPAAVDWLDLNRIQARAEVHRRIGETTGEPFLTYDKAPDRLVWAVPLTNANGEVRHIYVAGNTVYVPPGEGTYD
jgi:hypothetical protein